MSYADLKPVKFELEPIYSAPPTDAPQDYFHPYEHPVYQAYPVEHQPLHFHHHQHHQHHHQQTPEHHHHFIPPTPRTPTTTTASVPTTPQPFRTPVSAVRRPSAENTDTSDVSEELRNHWMPMTWIERSSDDPQVFNFVCLWSQCVSVSSSKDEFVEHLTSHVADEEEACGGRTATCRVRGCGRQMGGAELHRHAAMHVFQADCQQKGSEALIEKEDYAGIESCGFEPSTNINYEGEILVCLWENCGAPHTSLTELFDHVGHHIDEVSDVDRIEQDFQNGDRKNVFPCKWSGCNHMSDSKSNLRRHARHHSGEKVLACPFCARFFSRRDKLYDHCVRRTILMKESDVEDAFSCKLCQKRFGTEKALCMHVTRHLVSHQCPLCALALSSRAEIHRHLMTKHSRRTKDFKCDVCSKMFFSESELGRHRVFHSDVMYNCKQCTEKFKWKKQLLKHMKEHDENFNPSPYTCHLCDRAYTTGFALGRHLTRQHRLQVPYGFSRFTYKKCADGLMRLQTKKLFRNGAGGEEAVPLPAHY